MGKVVTDIRRADATAIAGLKGIGVATVHEAQGRCGLMNPELRPIFPGAIIAGPAVTVSIPPCDNWMIHVAVEQCQPGDILVVAPTSYSDAGYFGELLARSLVARGVIGLIIDAGCRGTVKETIGNVNLPVVCAGEIVKPGDLVVADDDGVVVVPRDRAGEVQQLSKAREDKEEITRRHLMDGELGLDYYNFRERLAARGLTYVKQADDNNES